MIRAFDARDDEAIVALYTRLHAADATIDAPDLERWRAFRRMAIFEEGRSFLVAEQDGAIVAVMTAGTLPRGEPARRVRVFVDPAVRRRGIGGALFARGEADAAAEGVKTLETFVDARWAPGRAFAESRGFAVAVHDLFLARDASPFVSPMPAGVTIRPMARGEEGVVAAIANASLSRDVGFSPESAESIASYLAFPGAEIWIAEAAEPVGICHIEHRGALGYIQALGVLPAFESRGIGAALLARGIDALRVSAERIELCTEKPNERAQRLYARAGFSLAREAFTYRKSISL